MPLRSRSDDELLGALAADGRDRTAVGVGTPEGGAKAVREGHESNGRHLRDSVASGGTTTLRDLPRSNFELFPPFGSPSARESRVTGDPGGSSSATPPWQHGRRHDVQGSRSPARMRSVLHPKVQRSAKPSQPDKTETQTAKKPKPTLPQRIEALMRIDLRRVRWIEPLPRRGDWWPFSGPWRR